MDVIPKKNADLWSSWNSVPSVHDLQRDLNRLTESISKTFGKHSIEPWGGSHSSIFVPKIDVKEEKDEIVVCGEFPGMSEKDIQLSLKENVLTLRGEKKTEKEEKQKDYYRIERTFGTFERSLSLPCEVETNKVEAVYKNGILTVRLPKVANAKSNEKKITIKSS